MAYFPRIENTKTLQAFELNAGMLRSFLDGVSDDATVSVSNSNPDRPGERATVTLRVTSAQVVSE